MSPMEHPEDRLQERIARLVRACQEILESGGFDGIAAAFLYGSALSPLFRSDSDIDIALLDREDNPLSWRDQARLMDELERSTGHNVDLRMLREGRPSLQMHVLEQGRMVWAKDPAEVERYTRTILVEARRRKERSERDWPQILDRLAGLAASRP